MVIKAGPIALRAFLVLMESIGAEGIVGFAGGLLLLLGFMKLAFGGVLCCRKTKAQEYAEEYLDKRGIARGTLKSDQSPHHTSLHFYIIHTVVSCSTWWM